MPSARVFCFILTQYSLLLVEAPGRTRFRTSDPFPHEESVVVSIGVPYR